MLSKKFINIAGSLLALLAVAWFVGQLFKYDIPALSISTIPYLVLITLTYFVSTLIGGLSWFILLRSAGEEQIHLLRVISIICLSQIGKYVPGNVAHYIGRVVLAKKYKLGITNTLFTIFIETVWVMAVAALLALVAVAAIGNHIFSEVPYLPRGWMFAGIIIAAIVSPLLTHLMFKKIAGWWAVRSKVEMQSVRMPSAGTFWRVWLLYIINYSVLGLVLLLIAEQVFNNYSGNILLLSGIFAVAWIVGFITPGAPAGLGIREVVLVAALAPVYGHEYAVGIAAVLRIVTVLGDCVAFLLGLAIAGWVDKKVTV